MAKRDIERQICDMLDEGASPVDIASATGCSVARVLEVQAAYTRDLAIIPERPAKAWPVSVPRADRPVPNRIPGRLVAQWNRALPKRLRRPY